MSEKLRREQLSWWHVILAAVALLLALFGAAVTQPAPVQSQGIAACVEMDIFFDGESSGWITFPEVPGG